MKVKIGYTKYVEEEFELPKKFQFRFTKDEDDYTDKEWDIIENGEFDSWLRSNTDFGEDIEIIDYYD